MAGGNFDKNVEKVRPGTYMNINALAETITAKKGTRGTVIIPLIRNDYGPAGKWLKIESTSPESQKAALGHSIYESDDNRMMLLIREALKHATTIYAYILAEGDKAMAGVAMEEVSDMVKAVTNYVNTYMAGKDGLDGCDIVYTESETHLDMIFKTAPASAKNTGIFDLIAAMVADGYTVTVGGTAITSAADFQKTDAFTALAALEIGGSCEFSICATKDEDEVEFSVSCTYPEDSEDTAGTLTVDSSERKLEMTAKYGGTRGNSLEVTITANAVEGYDVIVNLAGTKVETFEGVSTIEDLIDQGSSYIDFAGTGELTEVAGINLAGGTDGVATNGSITDWMDAWEGIHFDTACLPVDDNDVKAAAAAKIQYMRSNMGKRVQVVMPDYAADYEGVINVTNSVMIGDDALTHAEACAWVAGATAGAGNTDSLTYVEYEDATEIVDPKTHETAETAIKNGEFFFSVSDGGLIVVEYDINSLITYGGTTGKDKSYRKNRVIRVFDTFADSIQEEFPPNKFSNNDTDWDIEDGIGKGLLQQFEEAGAIRDVDYDNDFAVDRTISNGDSTYFDIYLRPVDSSEKLYFSVTTES